MILRTYALYGQNVLILMFLGVLLIAEIVIMVLTVYVTQGKLSGLKWSNQLIDDAMPRRTLSSSQHSGCVMSQSHKSLAKFMLPLLECLVSFGTNLNTAGASHSSELYSMMLIK
jgi:hypothetical protein